MISVCMATYNGEKYLKEQVDSILVQIGLDDELIVSDDGSSDTTVEILQNYNDTRIKIHKNEIWHGVVGNFENALKQAKGDYIFLSDQDDVWINGKISKCVEILQTADLVVTDCIVTDDKLNPTCQSFFIDQGSRRGFFKNLIKNSYLGACVAFKRDVLLYVLPIPRNLPVYHEGWIASLVDIKGRVVFANFKGIYFRRHSNNTSLTSKNKHLSLYRQLRYRVLLLWLVTKKIVQ